MRQYWAWTPSSECSYAEMYAAVKFGGPVVEPCVLSAKSAVPFVSSIASIEPPLPSAHAAGAMAMRKNPATATTARFIVPPAQGSPGRHGQEFAEASEGGRTLSIGARAAGPPSRFGRRWRRGPPPPPDRLHPECPAIRLPRAVTRSRSSALLTLRGPMAASPEGCDSDAIASRSRSRRHDAGRGLRFWRSRPASLRARSGRRELVSEAG